VSSIPVVYDVLSTVLTEIGGGGWGSPVRPLGIGAKTDARPRPTF
jgi:hypothetical protein